MPSVRDLKKRDRRKQELQASYNAVVNTTEKVALFKAAYKREVDLYLEWCKKVNVPAEYEPKVI